MEFLDFLKNPHKFSLSNKNYNDLYQFFFQRAISFFSSDHDKIKNLFHDFIVNKILENKTFQDFVKRATDKEIISYFNSMVKNFLINEYKKKQEVPEKFLSDVSKDERITVVILIDAYQILKIINQKLKIREKKLLCRYLNPHKYNFLQDLSNDAYYKAIERLKLKIKKLNFEKDFSKESLELFFEKIYLSEICEKICKDKIED